MQNRARLTCSSLALIFLLPLGLCGLSACSDSNPPATQDGATDTTTIDSGLTEAGLTEAGPTDAARENAPDTTTPDDARPSDAGGDAWLTIRVGGNTTPKTLNDGLSGQTPTTYTMSLARYEIMTSATDPNPVVVFDHGAKPVQIDMLAGAQVAGRGKLSSIPSGTYTHGRVQLTSTTFVIAATVHAAMALPGTVEITAALSDTTIGGKAWKQGEVSYTFSVWPTPVPGLLPPLPATPGGQIIQKDGKTWMIFPFTKPLKIVSSSPSSWTSTIIYEVADSFRWQDNPNVAGYKAKVFDVSVLPAPSFETVKAFGATGYLITEKKD